MSMRGLKHKEGGKWKKAGIFLILFLILIFLSNSLNNVYQKKKEADVALTRMKERVADLQNREEVLKQSLARLDTIEGMKFEIRKKLNVAEVGESVAVIVDQEEKATESGYFISPWQKFKNFFSWLFE